MLDAVVELTLLVCESALAVGLSELRIDLDRLSRILDCPLKIAEFSETTHVYREESCRSDVAVSLDVQQF